MTEREIFLAIFDLPDPAARAQYLDGACGGDPERRARIESLLLSHDAADSFLDNPAVKPPAPDALATQELGDAATPDDDANGADDLQFLSPSTRPDSLGRLGHYEILQVLGRGGFGVVFRAFDDVLQRVVAVKVMAPQIATLSPARKRFLREARSSAAVRHENVVHVYEVGEQPLPYLVMEFVPGETLQQKLDRSGPLEVSEVLRIGRQIAEGLAAAHASDLIHRDIKPANILLEGGSQKVKITDFGLARAADDASISQSGVIAGTPMFMAPEQALGQEIDQRADLFSFGSVLYQMVSGRPPFRAPSALAVLKRVAEESPRPIPEIIPETPAWLCEIIAKLHAKNPEDRFQSAREIADVLADCEAQLKAHDKVKDFSRIPRGKPQRSGRWKWAAAAAVLMLPVIALAATEFAGVTHLFRGQQTTHEPINPEIVPTPVAAKGTPDAEGWVQLFNGKDLEGWNVHGPEKWRVQDKILVGTGTLPKGCAVTTDRFDYRNFHFRFEAKINKAGACRYGRSVSGKVCRHMLTFQSKERMTPPGSDSEVIPADMWFVQEVIADGKYMTFRINGQTILAVKEAVYNNAFPDYNSRLLVLSVADDIEVHFRKIEIKELPASSPPLAKEEPLPPTFKNGIGMEFVIVPKGKSWLGGGKDKLGDREVEIPADFYLGKYEVTQEEWEKVMGENPSFFSRTGEGKDAVKDVSDADLKRFPADSVSWDQCQLFVAKLNKLEKDTGWVYRLPTEAEWEYACRGGPMSDKLDSAFDFYLAKPTNTLLPDLANFDKGLNRTCKVGSYPPNRLGLYDMCGNVWEFCDNTRQRPDGTRWLGRGGSWRANPRDCQAWVLGLAPRGYRDESWGLRLARVPFGAPSPEAKTPPPAAAFTDADVKRIAALPAEEQVEEVRKELVRRNPGFDGQVEHKIEDADVTELRINTDKVTDVSPIRVFNALRVLDCSGSPTPDWKRGNGLLADLTPLKGMDFSHLLELNLNWTKVDDAGLAYFKDCKNLRNIQLFHTPVSDAGLAHFKDCKNLTQLCLWGEKVSDVGVAYFKDCKDLTWLKLESTQVSDAGLVHFKDCKSLADLNLSSTKVTDAGLSNFKDCENLSTLWLNDTQVSDAGLAHFKGCDNLTNVGLANTSITETGLAQFKDRKNLINLNIRGTKVTDLSLLKGLPLKSLICDFNADRDAEILRSIKTLETINGKPMKEFWKEVEGPAKDQ